MLSHYSAVVFGTSPKTASKETGAFKAGRQDLKKKFNWKLTAWQCSFEHTGGMGSRRSGGFCSAGQSCLTFCTPMDCRTPGFPVLYCLPKFARPLVHWVTRCHLTISSSVIPFSSCLQSFQASESLPISPSCSRQVAKVLELQHQSFLWLFRVQCL